MLKAFCMTKSVIKIKLLFKKELKMIKNDEYIDFLNKIIVCVNKGDYYSIKELANIKLEELKLYEKQQEKDVTKFIKKNKCINDFNNLEKNKFLYLMNKYLDYVFFKIHIDTEIKKIVTFDEFVQKIFYANNNQ